MIRGVENEAGDVCERKDVDKLPARILDVAVVDREFVEYLGVGAGHRKF